MTTFDFANSGARRGAPTKRRTARPEIVSRLWARFRRRQRLARAAAELSALDERMLRDIGLTPFDVVLLRCSHGAIGRFHGGRSGR